MSAVCRARCRINSMISISSMRSSGCAQSSVDYHANCSRVTTDCRLLWLSIDCWQTKKDKCVGCCCALRSPSVIVKPQRDLRFYIRSAAVPTLMTMGERMNSCEGGHLPSILLFRCCCLEAAPAASSFSHSSAGSDRTQGQCMQMLSVSSNIQFSD
jgi:hypothetical protein